MEDELECLILLSMIDPTDRNPSGWTSSDTIAEKHHKDKREVRTKCDFMVEDGLLKKITQERGHSNAIYEITSEGNRKKLDCKKVSSQ